MLPAVYSVTVSGEGASRLVFEGASRLVFLTAPVFLVGVFLAGVFLAGLVLAGAWFAAARLPDSRFVTVFFSAACLTAAGLRAAATAARLPDDAFFGALAFARAAASRVFSRRDFRSSRILAKAAVATASCWPSEMPSSASKKAWATIFVPRGARVRASSLMAMTA